MLPEIPFATSRELPVAEESGLIPPYREIIVPEANVEFRISPAWKIGDPSRLVEGRSDLSLEEIDMHGQIFYLAHRGMIVKDRFKKSKKSGTWYYAESIQGQNAAVYIQELLPETVSSHHRHNSRIERIIPLYGFCIVDVNDVPHSLWKMDSLTFNIRDWHRVYTQGSSAVNALVINGRGDCKDMTDHEPRYD